MPNNNLYGTIPKDFFRLVRNLSIVDLSHNELSGSIPTEVRHLRNIDDFSMGHNLISGHIPLELSHLGGGAATKLDLGNNLISGALPTELSSLSSLEYLRVGMTKISGTLPDSTPKCFRWQPFCGYFPSTLQVLDAEHSQISGVLTADAFAGLKRLRVAGLAGLSSLSGTIPTQLGSSTWLTRATFSNSAISGSLPTQLGSLSSLSLFDASYTSLSGTVPTELFESDHKLRNLNLQSTALSGTLPSSFATLETLRYLYLPRSLTQYLRAKFCREELHLPLRFNYFWDLAAAAVDGRSQVYARHLRDSLSLLRPICLATATLPFCRADGTFDSLLASV